MWQNSGRLISIFMCEHKNIKMSNLWQPFTDARRRHVTKVFDEQADSFDMTSLAGMQLCIRVALPFMWQLANVVADVISVCVKLLVAAGKWQSSGRTPAALCLVGVHRTELFDIRPEPDLPPRFSVSLSLIRKKRNSSS
jgi:hypothetical protein